MSLKSAHHNKSAKSERLTAGVSFHDLNNTGIKSNKTSDSAFITSVPGMTYFNKFNFKVNPYDTNQPINEEDERREEVAGDIIRLYTIDFLNWKNYDSWFYKVFQISKKECAHQYSITDIALLQKKSSLRDISVLL